MTSLDSLVEHSAYRWHTWLLVYLLPIIVVAGLAGNILSVAVLSRPAMRGTSTYNYLAVLSVVDAGVLVVGATRTFLAAMLDYDVMNYANWTCTTVQFVGHVLSHYAAALLVLVTVERFVVVRWPLRAAVVCRPIVAWATMGGLLVIFTGINIHFAWTVNLQTSTVGNVTFVTCDKAANHRWFMTDVWPWLDAILYTMLPFVIILVLNTLIVWRLWHARHARHQLQPLTASPVALPTTPTPRSSTTQFHSSSPFAALSNSNSADSKTTNVESTTQQLLQKESFNGHHPPHPHHLRSSGKMDVGALDGYAWENEQRLTVMLLLITAVFLICTLPVSVAMFINADIRTSPKPEPRNDVIAVYVLVTTCGRLLMYVHHSINFFLYCATGRKFRRELCFMLGRKNRIIADRLEHTNTVALTLLRSSDKSVRSQTSVDASVKRT